MQDTPRLVSVVRRLIEVRRSLPDVYWVVWVGTLVNRMGGFVMPLLTFYLTKERGFSVATAGRIVALFGAGAVVAALVGGVLADRLGRRPTMLLSMVGGGVLMIGLGFARDIWWIAANTFLLGIAGELYRPAVFAFVSDVVPAKDRLRAFGYLYWVINLAFAAAILIGGLMARWSYTALFIGDAVTMFGFAVLVAVKLPETRPTEHDGQGGGARLADVLADRTFMIFWALTFGLTMMFYQSTVALSAHLTAQGFDEAAFAALIAINGVLIVLLQPMATAWSARFDRGRVLAFAAMAIGAGFALHGASSIVAVHCAAVVMWTIGEIVLAPINSTTVASLSSAEARGRYQGVFGMSWGLASCLGPLGGSEVMDRVGADALWLGCLGVGLVCAIGYVASAPGRRARGA